MQVLLVEDDPLLDDDIARVLRGHGMAVVVLTEGAGVDEAIAANDLTLVLLDIDLPDIDGLEVLMRLRATGATLPVLLLSARDAVDDRVDGFERGADDYLVNPFATAELLARVKALARRSRLASSELWVGDLALDVSSHRARVGERLVNLSEREWAVLEQLLQRRGRVLSKQQIMDAILPWDAKLTCNAVEVYVSRIRSKITDAGVSIRTIRGFGYILETDTTCNT